MQEGHLGDSLLEQTSEYCATTQTVDDKGPSSGGKCQESNPQSLSVTPGNSESFSNTLSSNSVVPSTIPQISNTTPMLSTAFENCVSYSSSCE